MRTTNNLFRKAHNCTHFKWWFTQFERKCNILEIFHYFQYFERFRSMKKWQISKPKIVDWYLDFSKESYTTLKSVISSFKICFQNYGQLKRKFLRPKNTSSTFLKFELSRLGGPMLKTRKNTIRNQFEQQWFNVISFQKPRRVYKAIWYKLKSFPIKKGRFKLPTPAKCISYVKLSREGKALLLKSLTYSKFFTSMNSDFSLQNNVVNVCCSFLSMMFPCIGNVKYPHGRTYQQQRFKSKRPKIANGEDCVTFHRSTAYHCTVVTRFFAGSHEKFSFRYEWYLISATLKVRLRADDAQKITPARS